jgi:hypothetical protein
MRLRPPVANRGQLIALGVLAVALLVRVWDISARALWFDEASEFWIATAPWRELAASARTGTGDPPLYTFLLHAWMQVDASEAWLRMLSVLASVTGVAGVMVLARRVAGAGAALCAGLLMAVLPADVRYAQEAGQYGFVPAVVAWNLVFLLRLMGERTWRAVLGWSLTALAASYLYYGAVLPVAACFFCVVVESIARRDMRTRRAAGTALVLYILGLIPIMITYLPTQLSRVIQSGGVQTPLAPGGHGLAGFLHTKWELMKALIAFQFTGWPHTQVPPSLVVVPVIALVLWAAPRAPRLVVWLMVSMVTYGIAYQLGVFPMGYRWGLIVTPLLVCAMAAGLAPGGALRARPAMLAVFAALLVVCAISLPNRTLYDRIHPDNTGAWPETEDMRAAAEYWIKYRAPGQATYVYYGAAPAFAYYTRDLIPRAGLPPTWCLSCWHDPAPPAFCRQDDVYYGRWIRGLDDAGKIQNVTATLGGRPESLWLVFGHMVPNDDARLIAGFIRGGYRLEAAAQGMNASVCLLTRNRERK